jgi:membrane protein DedA with SNARE-associated domain
VIESELIHYGYLFVFVGTIFEGDATLLSAAFLAHRGYLQLSWVVIVSAISTLLSSQIYYLAARYAGAGRLESVCGGSARFEKITGWLQKHGGLLVFGARFMPGFRMLTPLASGATMMRPGRFLFWNSLGAIVWVVVFGAAGYLGGHAFGPLFDGLRHHTKIVAAAVALLAAAIVLWKLHGADLMLVWSLRHVLFPRKRRR